MSSWLLPTIVSWADKRGCKVLCTLRPHLTFGPNNCIIQGSDEAAGSCLTSGTSVPSPPIRHAAVGGVA